MDLSVRSMAPEEMDAPSTSPEDYATCLRDLAAVNRVTFTHRPTLNWLARATRDRPGDKAVTILDIACGHGDLLRAIHRWAARRRLPVHLSGLDLNPRSAEVAAAATPPDMSITWLTCNVFTYTPEPSPDFIVTSQFAHHLTDAELVTFIRWLNRHAAHGWFIADLHRHALAYYGFPILARLARWHRIVREDGRISIARSFRRPEWTDLLTTAGVMAEINWRLPFRYCVSARK
jgi:2-polyprenyl-3-methyl-5-hydroxy-6-metoxy-1,4-benzoquinol methylase